MENHKVLGFMTSGVLVLSDYCEHSGKFGPAKKDIIDYILRLYLVKWMHVQIYYYNFITNFVFCFENVYTFKEEWNKTTD